MTFFSAFSSPLMISTWILSWSEAVLSLTFLLCLSHFCTISSLFPLLPPCLLRCFHYNNIAISSQLLSSSRPQFSSVSSVAQSCPTLCDPMNRSKPGLPVYHQLLESTQTHAHRVGDAIRPSHPLCPLLLLPPIPPSIRVFCGESVLLKRWPKYWSFGFSISPSNEYQDWSPLGWTGWISLQSKGLSRVFSNTTIQKHQFSCAQLSL